VRLPSRLRLVAVAAALAAAGVGVPIATSTAAAPFFPGCAAASGHPDFVVDRVGCLQVPSAALGGTTAFSYFIPPACAPAAHPICPVIYLLHGFGGSYTSMLGTSGDPSAYVAALASGPRRDPHNVSDPWNYSDPAGWIKRWSINAILVAPDGRTVPGGYGPEAGLDGYWTDWNPRLAKGGDDPRYDTPAPRFEAQLLDELIPYVEKHLPVGKGRAWRSLTGESLGGYGAYAIGLRHPDLFSSLGTVSGAMNFLFAPGLDPTDATLPAGVGGVDAPGVDIPAATGAVPIGSVPAQARNFAVALLAFGDPVADQAYFRGHMPRDLARNAHARARYQSLDLVGFSNDAVAHNPADLTNPGGFAGAQAFESIVLPMNLDQRLAFRNSGVHWNFELHPGTHSGEYWNAWYRGLYVHQYALMRHDDGSGGPFGMPAHWSYRSTDDDFSVWRWHFAVDRPATEFLDIVKASCRRLVLRGTGAVTVSVDKDCRTGRDGRRTFTVDLGPSHPVDELGGVGATPAYGKAAKIDLTR
jgi:S-formylglutathione hydrolase FrmB